MVLNFLDSIMIGAKNRFSMMTSEKSEGGIDTVIVVVILCVVAFAFIFAIRDKGNTFITKFLGDLSTKTEGLWPTSGT